MNNNGEGGYVVELRGLKVQCATVEQVVEAVRALEPLANGHDREVAVPMRTDREVALTNGNAGEDSPLTRELYAMLREAPRALRPVEIVRALRKRGLGRAETKYARVYGALRHGDFMKQGGRWSVNDGA